MAEASASVPKSENVLIHAGDCAITVLPSFGGKIASIRIGSHELLQTPLAPIVPRSREMAFDQSDASGWDECLPSVAACSISTSAGIAEIPDHGDLWRVEWVKQGTGYRETGAAIPESGGFLKLFGKCFSLPIELERTMHLYQRQKGWRLELRYRVRNCGKYVVPWSWAAHPLFVCEEGDRIHLPATIHAVRVEGSRGERLGKSGSSVGWPVAKLTSGETKNLSVVDASDSGVGDKLFAGPLNPAENWCALERASAGLRIGIRFETAAIPYLGLWLCYGGWPDGPGAKQVCVAMEPSTAPVDSLAVTGRWSRELAPSESFSWPMQVDIERIETKTHA